MAVSKKDELVNAAIRVFGREGFHASGIEKVLQEAGVSRMTLYNHFKSKEELILAALRRREAYLRERIMQFVEKSGGDPAGRILAVFDFHEHWFRDRDFAGCTLLNATSEFSDPDCAIRKLVSDQKRAFVDYLRTLASSAGLREPECAADEFNLLLSGAIVTARAIEQSNDGDVGAPARIARRIAVHIIAVRTP